MSKHPFVQVKKNSAVFLCWSDPTILVLQICLHLRNCWYLHCCLSVTFHDKYFFPPFVFFLEFLVVFSVERHLCFKPHCNLPWIKMLNIRKRSSTKLECNLLNNKDFLWLPMEKNICAIVCKTYEDYLPYEIPSMKLLTFPCSIMTYFQNVMRCMLWAEPGCLLMLSFLCCFPM